MSAILRLMLFLLLSLPVLAEKTPVADDCRQLILVVSPRWDSPKATLERFERRSGGWRAVGRPIPVILGGSGMGWGLGEHSPGAGPQKKEGDNRAPAGVFALTQLWLRPGIAPPGPGGFIPQRIQPDTIAVDDPDSRLYNRILRTSQTPDPDWESWEKMNISDYDRVLVVAHNLEKPQPGRGSCIFVHRWDTPDTPTSGCTAMEEKNLVELIRWLRPDSRPRLVQLPESEAREWRERGWIPASSR